VSIHLYSTDSNYSSTAYISNRRLLLSLADAGGRVMYAYKDLLELAGLTTRLYTLISTLHNLPPLPQGEVSPDNGIIIEHADICVPSQPQNGVTDENGFSSSHAHHHVHPPLVKDLSLILKQGEHLMITGSNGVGKTSVARVLAGLWPPSDSGNLLGGSTSATRVQRPPARSGDGKRNVFVVPQRSYMVSGSLLDQVIYPDSYADFVDRCEREGGVEEGVKKLMEILRMVHLDHLPEREGGWFTRKEWRDVLSGGEKQRVSDCCLTARYESERVGLDGNGKGVLSTAKVCDSRWCDSTGLPLSLSLSL
jgi:ATP-binding cassette subfamily D (ALD) long-chain fatty acid import protein